MRKISHHSGFDQAYASFDPIEAVGMFRQDDVNVGDAASRLRHGGLKAPRTSCHFRHSLPQRIDLGVDVAEIAKDKMVGFVSHRLKIIGSAMPSTSGLREHPQ